MAYYADKDNKMSEDERRRNERDLVLAPNEFAYILDETKGNVDVYVGSHKTSLANTDQPVIFEPKIKSFRRVSLEASIQKNVVAPEGWYLILKNPSKSVEDKHPKRNTRSSLPTLDVGRKINIAGPASFALWPGQMVKVLQGHHIRSNQYLLVRIYDEDAAKENWKNTVIKAKDDSVDKTLSSVPTDLVMGNLYVIKGTEVSFYIPPTGVEVVPEADTGNLVRDAVTLERLEYCLLKDEDGNKRYVQGPNVVFPEPTEIFIDKKLDSGEKTKKFRAIELSETSGLYIKVIADYKDTNTVHKVGEELFVTGKEQMIYFPREEHAIIKYGDSSELYYGIAIPDGEARYVMNRNSGEITLVKGPQVFLPDPRKEVIVRRTLDQKICELLYPNNDEAAETNLKLSDSMMRTNGPAAAGCLHDEESYGVTKSASTASKNLIRSRQNIDKEAARGFEGDCFDRNTKYSAPRVITLNTKYDGAVSADIWSGYAMMLVRKSGARRVVLGPQTAMLEYDENPQILSLSTGKPKNTDYLLKTAYLQVTANKVSDIVTCETKDFCKLNIKLSYRVNFVGDDHEKWFAVDNYVKFMCDHMRSRLRNEVMKFGIEEFYLNSVGILQDIILGTVVDNKVRAGFLFAENNMHIYDVDVLGVVFEDKEVEKGLVQSQRNMIAQNLSLNTERARLSYTKEVELIKQSTMIAQLQTEKAGTIIALEKLKLENDLNVLKVKNSTEVMSAELTANLEHEQSRTAIALEAQKRQQAKEDAEIAYTLRQQEVQMKQLDAETQSLVQKASAVSPEFIAALQAFGDKQLIERVATAMAPMSIIGGDSVVNVLQNMLSGSELGDKLKSFVAKKQ